MLRNIISLLAGIIGGIVALIIAVLLEVLLGTLYKPLPLAGNQIFLIFLAVPALIEEITKVTVAKRIFIQRNNFWAIVGTGLGFGLAEAYSIQNQSALGTSLVFLPLVHFIFLTTGFLIAKRLTKDSKYLYLEWLIASTLLHWGYNFAQAAFLLKP